MVIIKLLIKTKLAINIVIKTKLANSRKKLDMEPRFTKKGTVLCKYVTLIQSGERELAAQGGRKDMKIVFFIIKEN